LVSLATHGCKLLVDGVGGQMPRFQVHAIAHDDDAVEGQPRLGAVPGDELVDGVLQRRTMKIGVSPIWRRLRIHKGCKIAAPGWRFGVWLPWPTFQGTAPDDIFDLVEKKIATVAKQGTGEDDRVRIEQNDDVCQNYSNPGEFTAN